jgi:hypothetical protein
MKKISFKKGLFMTTRLLQLLCSFNIDNLTKLLKILTYNTGVKTKYNTTGVLDNSLQVMDGGGGNVYVKAGMALLDDFEPVELTADSGNMAVPDGGVIYSIMIGRQDTEKEVGTISVSNGSLTLTGTDTKFTEALQTGDRIILDSSNPGNQGTLIIDTVTDDTTASVEAVDANGNTISFTTESGLDFTVVGKFAEGYPIGGVDRSVRNNDEVLFVVTEIPGSYPDLIILAEVTNNSGVLNINDKRDLSLLESFHPTLNQDNLTELTDGGDTTLHYHEEDRKTSNANDDADVLLSTAQKTDLTDGNDSAAHYHSEDRKTSNLNDDAGILLNATQKTDLTDGGVTVLHKHEDISRTATENQDDSPAPDIYGGGTIWCEGITNSQTPVKLDDSIDWRDRIITVKAFIKASATPQNHLPGGTSQKDIEGRSWEVLTGGHDIHDMSECIFYSGPGSNSPGLTSGFHGSIAYDTAADYFVEFFVDDGTIDQAGDLYMIILSSVTNEYAVIAKIEYSPVQNHV